MAIVYLARDLRHERLVALKTLRPELLPSVGPERFLREIQIAARLQHPNILPLHDSGEIDGLLYYVMPYVEGESLRARLVREGQLPFDEMLHITRQVADALAYAHGHGVVHRDIKPENILLSGKHTLVADFGIARAITEAAGERLTETGLALGTAAYMSPEQAVGDTRLDGRSDLYSLGCVVYEMIVGEPPFTGPSARAILARHSFDPVPPLRTLRNTVPKSIEQAVRRALAKSPADRFPTVTAFADALQTSEFALTPPAAWRSGRGIAGAAIAIGIAVVAALVTYPWAKPPSLDQKLVTILPFRASEVDSAHTMLSRALPDFLAKALAEAGGIRTVDPVTLASVRPNRQSANLWTDTEARSAATKLGAGLILRGNVGITSGRLTASAELLDNRAGEVLARADASSSPDSLSTLSRQIAATLLIRGAREPESRLQSLLLARPAALHSYLEGRRAYRKARTQEALDQFVSALTVDSTFADAALAAAKAADARGGEWVERGARLAWTSRERLSIPDRDYLRARLGPRFPEESPLIERLRVWEELIGSFQDRPDPEFRYETLFQYADLLFHNGLQMGIEDALHRAAAAFEQALKYDTTFTGATEHLRDIKFLQGDTAGLRFHVNRRLAMRLTDEDRWLSRWMLAIAVRDSASLRSIPRDFAHLSLFNLSQQSGLGLDFAERAARQWLASAATEHERVESTLRWAGLDLNLGRPDAARALLDTAAGATPLHHRLYHAIFWDGDTASAVEEANRLRRDLVAMRPSARDSTWYQRLCALEHWRMFRKDSAEVTRTVRTLRAVARQRKPSTLATDADNCANLLNRWRLVALGGSVGLSAVEDIDQWLRSVPPGWRQLHCANLLVASWWEARGELRRALNAARRRNIGRTGACLSSFRRLEGRLALATGDTAGAIAAWRHFLALRADPEPALRRERDRIGALVTMLQGK